MKLYIIGKSSYYQGEKPQYELFCIVRGTLYYLGSGPKIAAELLKKYINYEAGEIYELTDVSNNSFIQIMTSTGFALSTN